MRLILLFLFGLLLNTGALALNPSRTYPRLPDDFNVAYDSVKIRTPDGYELNTWLLQPSTATIKSTTVLLVGSDAGNMADLLPYAAQLVARGYPVVTFDYRGFGDSSNFAIKNELMYYREFITDYATVADWVKAYRRPERLAVMGFSMGTLIAAAGYARSGFDALVGESTVLDPTAVLARLHARGHTDTRLPPHAALDADCLLEISVPMLLFAAVADPITTLGDSQRVAAVNDRGGVVAHDGGHLRAAVSLGLAGYVGCIVDLLAAL